jgi:hypothetical protein
LKTPEPIFSNVANNPQTTGIHTPRFMFQGPLSNPSDADRHKVGIPWPHHAASLHLKTFVPWGPLQGACAFAQGLLERDQLIKEISLCH